MAADVDDGLPPLASAVRRNNLSNVLQLLGEGADPNETDMLGETPLFEAAASSRKDMVAALVASRADVNRHSLAGGAASDICANRSMQLLLALCRGVRLDGEAETLALQGVSPFLRRALWPELRRLRAEAAELGEAEEEISIQESAMPVSPLALAVQAGNLQLVLRLLQDRADPNEVDAVGETPLFEAATTGNANIMAALLLANADPRWQSPSSNCALDFAANGSTQLLLELFQGDRLERVKEDDLCLQELSEGLRGTVLRVLGRRWNTHDQVQAPTEDEAKSTTKHTADTMVTEHDKPESFPEEEPPAGVPDAAGEVCEGEVCTPLALAARAEDLPLVLQLLEQQADPNEGDALGETPLFEAALTGNINVAAALLVHGADPGKRSLSDMVAVDLASNSMMKALLASSRGESLEPAVLAELLAELRPELREALRHIGASLAVSSRLRQGSRR